MIFSLQSLKAWVALAGALVTAVIATLDVVPQWLAIVSAVLTAAATWLVRNADPEDPYLPDEDE